MTQGVNSVTIIGGLGKDPEVRYSASGVAVTNLRVAVGSRRKDGETWVDHTEWVPVVVFGKTAENVGQYLLKGRQIYVEGRLQTRSYKDKDGVEKWSTEVVANTVLFLGGAPGEGKAPARESKAPRKAPVPEPNRDAFYDDGLPL